MPNNSDDWTVAVGRNMDDDKAHAVVIRVRQNMSNHIRSKSHGYLLNIRWVYLAGNDGLPGDHDAGLMDELEDHLTKGLESTEQALLVASVTGNGVKEWLWYAKDVEVTQALFNKVLTGEQPYPIDLNVMLDPDWQHYLKLAGTVRSGADDGPANDNGPRTIN